MIEGLNENVLPFSTTSASVKEGQIIYQLAEQIKTLNESISKRSQIKQESIKTAPIAKNIYARISMNMNSLKENSKRINYLINEIEQYSD